MADGGQKVRELRESTRWVADNLPSLIYALVRIALHSKPSTSRNIARNALDDAGLKYQYDEEALR